MGGLVNKLHTINCDLHITQAQVLGRHIHSSSKCCCKISPHTHTQCNYNYIEIVIE